LLKLLARVDLVLLNDTEARGHRRSTCCARRAGFSATVPNSWW
jgi:hypothetical protein